MEEILEATTDNATSSWYGFDVQGKIGILYLLKMIKKFNFKGLENLILEYEYMEDFAIAMKDNDSIIYKDIYQVKARKKLQKKDIEKVYGELGFKKAILNDTNVHLISMCDIKSTVDIKKCIKDYIKKYEEETKLLKNYEKLEMIQENLSLTYPKSNLKTIRNIVRKKYKKTEDIKNIIEIKDYCDFLMSEYEKYKNYIDNTDSEIIDIIIEDFEQLNKNIVEYIKCILKELEPDKIYKQTDEYLEKIKNALIYYVSANLENHILKQDKLVFMINCKEIVNIILEEQSKINELHYLYLNNQRLEKQFQEYCLDCEETDNCKNDYTIKYNCELNKLIKNIRWMNLKNFKSLILNCNPHIDRKNTDFDIWTSVIEISKLHNFIFDEMKKNKYIIKDQNIHTYLKSIDDNCLFSFIDLEKQKKLLRDLENNFMYNRNIYEDNDVILNRNLNFTYVPGEILSKNQHWEEGIGKEKDKILSKSVKFMKFKEIGGNDETNNK
ncbi:ABC-three component system protein [Paraclostridium sordellii]|uniref:ABC-three component system protein n=1 Tax=Paraclostridium sordellii TaxID=1505 RepID=UPI0005DFEA58|nr:ABC-three component system protein [Paeniclostridium sordellii]CEO08433.1 Uncharacterised protein [[Clostridium] sordellii] [Paeniclostridium sordellii]CEP87208.1 Uncharacterised protein [[Clostridium] sordellii] [Paeniclostridium sordellii]